MTCSLILFKHWCCLVKVHQIILKLSKLTILTIFQSKMTSFFSWMSVDTNVWPQCCIYCRQYYQMFVCHAVFSKESLSHQNPFKFFWQKMCTKFVLLFLFAKLFLLIKQNAKNACWSILDFSVKNNFQSNGIFKLSFLYGNKILNWENQIASNFGFFFCCKLIKSKCCFWKIFCCILQIALQFCSFLLK